MTTQAMFPRVVRQPVAALIPHRLGAGILYIEDFDEAPHCKIKEPEPEPAPCEPAYEAADLSASREEGRLAGLAEARAEIASVQGALRLAALQSLSDAALKAMGDAQRIAEERARELAVTMLAVLAAALPALSARHAQGEVDAILQVLLPGLRCEPELRVRVHPDLQDHVASSLIGLLADTPAVVTVDADANLASSDVALTWKDGGAKRDCAAIWQHVANALAPLGLPSLEDITRGV